LVLAAALTALGGEANAEVVHDDRLCAKPAPAPGRCIPGISNSADCRVDDPLGAPLPNATTTAPAPNRAVGTEPELRAPASQRVPTRVAIIGETHPGYARDLDRPPQH
jgi:hypothetical protein